MTDAAKATVWSASYLPFGDGYQITGPASLDARFPGQWFQMESGLAYNWHRHYDPSTGRYLEPDPLGFIKGPSLYAYTGSSPLMRTDPEGRVWWWAVGGAVAGGGDLLWQLANNNWDFTCVDWVETAEWAIAGATAGRGAQWGWARLALNSSRNNFTLERARQDALTGRQLDPSDRSGQLTRAGRALEKHGGRPDSPFPIAKGNAAAKNQQGQKILEGIVNNEKSTVTPYGRQGAYDVMSPSGRGARFKSDGTLQGFLRGDFE